MMHIRHKRERYGMFSICTGCGRLQRFKNGRWSYMFRGENLTYLMLKALQPDKLGKKHV